jgi:drug/metabolite transporter (DMT)-like permease
MMGELAALGAAVSWTVSALFYRKALEGAKPVSANIIRLAASGGILLVFLVGIGKFGVLTSFDFELFVLAVVSGTIGLGVGDTLYLVSLKSIGVSRAVPLTCVYPLFTLLWAILSARTPSEQVTLNVVLGAVVIVLGILFLSHNAKSNVSGARKVLTLGVIIALATALLWSISISLMNIAVKEAPDLDHALVISVVRVASIGGLMLAFSPVLDRRMSFLRVGRKAVVASIVGGIFALGVGWFLLSYSFTVTSQAISVPISSTTPLFSMLAGILLLREKVTVYNFLGSIMVVVGIFLLFLA